MTENGQETVRFEEWAKLELFGRQVLAGRVSEQTIAGVGWIRVDVPAVDKMPGYTRFFQPAAVYAITPATEEIVRKLAEVYRTEPISRYELPAPRAPTLKEDEPSQLDDARIEDAGIDGDDEEE